MKTIDAILLATLKQLQQEVSEGKFPQSGICAYVQKKSCDEAQDARIAIYDQMIAWMKKWPESTGCSAFPVPDSKGGKSYERALSAYMSSLMYGTLWQGSEHAELRKQLLSWMIEQLEKNQNENS